MAKDSPEKFKPFVLIPTYNTGPRLLQQTVEEILESEPAPIWIIVDGSDDGSDEALRPLAEKTDSEKLRMIWLEKNEGKGCAVLVGATLALREGFTHMLTVDSDGQHPSGMISEYLAASREHSQVMILGQPIFDESAPRIRVNGRKYANFLAGVEVLGNQIGDALFGMRLYPLQAFVQRMECTIRNGAQRYDFEPEIAVRLVWDGVPTIKIPTPVKYFDESQGGVSHYHYWIDNFKMAKMHAFRLLPGVFVRSPLLLGRKLFKRQRIDGGRLIAKRIAARYKRHFHYRYAKIKLQTDPLYESVSQVLEPARGDIIDIGCGLGLLGHFLRIRGVDNPYWGFDYDVPKIEAAIEAARNEPRMSFRVGDAREKISEDFQGNVTLLDMLQFLSEEDLEALLNQVAGWIAPDGVLVIRNCIDDGSWRFGVTETCDRISNWLAWMKGAPRSYPTIARLNEILELHGLKGECKPMWGRTPFSNYLFVYRRT